MSPEIEDMIQALQGENPSFYQAKIVIDSIAELSAEEKREALRRFIPADKTPPPVPAAEISPPVPAKKFVDRVEDFIVAGEKVAARHPSIKRFLFKLAIWGFVLFLSYYALWALHRLLERWIMQI